MQKLILALAIILTTMMGTMDAVAITDEYGQLASELFPSVDGLIPSIEGGEVHIELYDNDSLFFVTLEGGKDAITHQYRADNSAVTATYKDSNLEITVEGKNGIVIKNYAPLSAKPKVLLSRCGKDECRCDYKPLEDRIKGSTQINVA